MLEREHGDKMNMLIFKCLQIALLLVFSGRYTIAEKKTQQSKWTYIIHMDKFNMPASFNDHLHWYDSSLKSVSESAEMLYTYEHVAHGFSTRLTNQEAELLAKQPGILSVIPEVRYELHTTRTPEFLGLENTTTTTTPLSLASGKQSEVVVGLLDTGVWPELKSFDDTGLGPVPSSWKGVCETGKNFNSSNCNRKLVGARFFPKGYEAAFGPIDEKEESRSPRDDDGHGSHTSTTAAGSAVARASLFGYASGTARGMATQARVATYKVCWLGGCFTSDIVAGIDKAIADGVNILSMSIGGGLQDYYKDIVSIGTFAATAHGILVSISAGNGGPSVGTLSNVAPWTITVGAGTIDRNFPAYITLGNGKRYTGASLYNGKLPSDSPLPLVYAGNVSKESDGNLCTTGSLIPEKVKGKIVICDRGSSGRVAKGSVVKSAGGVGMILANNEYYGEELFADPYLLPAAALGQNAGDEVKKYVFSAHNPTAKFAFGGTQLGLQPSPVVAAFSARGPNVLTPKILKPDLIAPGVNILAGWSGAVGPTGLDVDKRHVSFNIISGTSMSCPHVSGLAALLKGAHPEWSPAAIRSAFMTTAYRTYKNGQPIQDIATGVQATPLDYGAGHVDPVAALDPGLVYDATVDDYLSFFCALNYTSSQIKLATRRQFTCNKRIKYRVEDLNYPSFAVPFDADDSGIRGGSQKPSTVQYKRILSNVGTPSTYTVSVLSMSPSVKIVVEPQTLSFGKLYEKKSYTVTFTSSSSMPFGTNTFAHLEWSDGKHKVTSPIAFSWN
ncbi:subtilisin-like protease SBT1.7 [Gastrolobium bilobum]|uniref:subtilisin-like protease SBT1.7 n=1 Tax=Gastrolobium bilobum TaxID=150636 RepID=UPI002AB06C48|nr:subtilisin-like protease SBT1.7 [Gastrolobium bilobum]